MIKKYMKFEKQTNSCIHLIFSDYYFILLQSTKKLIHYRYCLDYCPNFAIALFLLFKALVSVEFIAKTLS